MLNYLRLSLLFLFFFSPSAHSAYTKYILDETSLETPPYNWAAGDDASITVDIGFPFPFGLVGNISQISINSNGALATSSWNTYSNKTLPQNTPSAIIAPYWDDIYRRTGTIRYGSLGTAPNRRFIAAWTDTPRYYRNGSCTFQVVLYENGDIRFRYSTDSISCSGSSATIGIQESSSTYNQHSYNSVIDLSKDILYTSPRPEITLQKTSTTLSDPINGTNNPKSIPGALSEYTLTATNEGLGNADTDSIIISDAVPSNTSLYIEDISGAGTGPIEFLDGLPSSGLSYSFSSLASTSDSLSFSNNGGSTYSYVPVADAMGLDSNVTHVRVATQGTFQASDGSSSPNFSFKFRVQIE